MSGPANDFIKCRHPRDPILSKETTLSISEAKELKVYKCEYCDFWYSLLKETSK